MVALPPPITAEITVDGAWQALPVRASDPVTITRGASAEGSKTQPGQAGLTIDNRDGEHSPRNPNSTLFGKIGRNTPIQIFVDAGDPWLAVPEGPGDARARTPDDAALDVTGDIDVRVDAQLENWNAGSITEICSKQEITGDQRSWRLMQLADHTIEFTWTTAGTGASGTSVVSTVVPEFPNSGRLALRATLDVDNGLGGYTCTIYTAPTIDGPWEILGDPEVTTTGTTSIFNSTAPLDVGDANGIVLTAPIGRFYAFQLYNGIDGTLVADADFTSLEVGTTAWTDSAGRSWTVENNAEISNTHNRMSGEIPAWPARRDLSGADVRSALSPAGILRRLGQGDSPLQSVLRREMAAPGNTAAIAYWPGEDGTDSTSIASAVGGQPMRIEGAPDLASFDEFACSDLLPVLTSGSSLAGAVPAYSATGETQVRWLMHVDAGGAADGERLISVWTTGTAARWDITYRAVGVLQLTVYDREDVEIEDSGNVVFDVDGKLLRVGLELTQDGSDIDWVMVTLEVDALVGVAFSGTLAGYTVGQVTRVIFAPDRTIADVAVGHFAVYDEITTIFDLKDELDAWKGEAAGRRIQRLCDENEIPFSVIDETTLDDTQAMGRQRIDTLLKLFQDCADADRGFLLEQRDALGLTYRGLRTLYNQAPVLELDFSAGVVGSPFAMTDDDKLTRNEIIVKREGGSEGRAVLEEGPLSVQAPPNGVGRGYDVSHTLNLEDDDQTVQLAGWLLHLGTFDGMRYTKVTVDLANPRVNAMAADILRVDVGDLIRLTDLPADLTPGNVDLIVQGYAEEMGPSAWRITFNCVPGEPYTVAVTDDPLRGKAGTSGSELAEDLTSTETAVDILTTDGPVWTSDVRQSPYQLTAGGETIKVTAPGGLVSPNPFLDTDATGWDAQGGEVERSTGIVHPHPEAVASAKLTPDGVSGFANALAPQTGTGTINPVASYTVSAWVYSPGGWGDVDVKINWHASNGAYISTSTGPSVAVAAGEWTYLEATLTSPATASSAFPLATLGTSPTADDVLYVWALRITRIKASAVYDEFGRTLTDSWGSADSGQAWVNSGTAADYDVLTGYGRQTHPSTLVAHISLITSPSADSDIYVDLATNALATGASLVGGPVSRCADNSNFYTVRTAFSTAGVISAILQKRVASVDTTLDTYTTPITHTAGTFIRIRLQTIGTSIKAKIWPVTDTEPGAWHMEATDSGLTAANSIGVRSFRDTGNTNTNAEFRWQNFDLVTPQTFTVARSQNGIVKTHAAGTALRLATPATVAL